MSNTSRTGTGISFVGALTLLFIALKLLELIDWPWLWVLSPMWISAALVATAIVLFVAVVVLVAICSKDA